jgi:hypothetical protein
VGAELALRPARYNKHVIFPKRGVELSDPANFASIGMTVTGMPALAAIAGVLPAVSIPRCATNRASGVHLYGNIHGGHGERDSDVTFPEPIVLNVSRTTD